MPSRSACFLTAILKKLFVEFLQHLLARGAVVESPSSAAHALVERGHVANLVLQTEFAEIAAEFVQGGRDGIAASEIVSFEKRLEDGERQDVLRHHVDCGVLRHRVVDGGAKFLMEAVEPLP